MAESRHMLISKVLLPFDDWSVSQVLYINTRKVCEHLCHWKEIVWTAIPAVFLILNPCVKQREKASYQTPIRASDESMQILMPIGNL